MAIDPNPARLRPFDHLTVAALPEYAAAAEALNKLVRAINDHQMVPETQDGWLDLVRNMTAAIPFSDCCEKCESEVYFTGVIPAGVIIENHGVHATYICPECGYKWTCGWSVTAPANFG
jgi:hypothetical protein